MSERVAHALSALNEAYFRHYPLEAVHAATGMGRVELSELLATQPLPRTITIWERLPAERGAELLASLPANLVRQLLAKADSVRLAQALARLPEERREALLADTGALRARELKGLMRYPYDSAGALMDVNFPSLSDGMSVRETLLRLRRRKPRFMQQLYIGGEEDRLAGRVELQDLALADDRDPLGILARPIAAAVLPTASRDELVELFDRHKLADLPVVDLEGRLVGVIHYDTLVTVVREESSADLLTMVGASREERALSKVSFVVRKRLPWLQINLLTAFLAAAVVGLFEGTIAKFTALAVLLPVVAGQSGNTGAQALAVTMRALALHEISTSHWWRVARKEVNAALVNGIAVALTTALGVLVWSASPGLALIIAISMVLSMIAAGLAGVLIPIALASLGQDPAQSSSIILTTITDVIGFFSFLGIATALSGLL